jgi:Terminase large subunit, T4likevirus-type, N-terminal
VPSASLLNDIRRVREALNSNGNSNLPDDPAAFGRSVLPLDPWQEEFLSGGKATQPPEKRRILLAARQCGKSAVAGIIAIHRALTRSNQTVLITAPTQDQATLVFRQARRFYYAVGAPIPARSMREASMELVNGSEIISRAAIEQSRRGFAVDLLIIDECASIEDDHVYDSLTPSLAAKDGDELLLSTPRGRRGFFSALWHDDPDIDKTMVTTFEPEKFRPERLERLSRRRDIDRARMPEPWWSQEYECLFVSGSNQVYPTEYVDRAIVSGGRDALDLTEIWS